ncbi:MAG: PDZ domain-containing protein, partial [Vulcanimicrobiaceae bacterium]
AGYAKIKPSLVKIWALDENGKPIQSGTGFVVSSDVRGSLVLTSAHTVVRAARLIVNIPGLARDISAHLKSVGPVDTALLGIDEPNMVPVQFVPHDRALREGSYVAVAGFLKNDESIEIAGLVPRILYPGTISSLPSDGRFIDLANLNIEEGLSGSPVFEPRTGEVVGMIDTRATNRQERGGYAISAPLVLTQFFEDQKVRVAYENAVPAPLAPAPLAPAPRAAFPSSAFQAAEPQPDTEPAEPVPQSQDPQQTLPQQQVQISSPAPKVPHVRLIRKTYGFALEQTPRGVLVQQVAPNSIAQRAGLRQGDIIVTINGQHITDTAQARELIANSPEGQLAVSVRRRNMLPTPP